MNREEDRAEPDDTLAEPQLNAKPIARRYAVFADTQCPRCNSKMNWLCCTRQLGPGRNCGNQKPLSSYAVSLIFDC